MSKQTKRKEKNRHGMSTISGTHQLGTRYHGYAYLTAQGKPAIFSLRSLPDMNLDFSP